MIAITFALRAESFGVTGLLHNKRTDGPIVYGQMSGRDVAIFHTGVGRKACERNIEKLFGTVQPNYLVSAGFAGGLVRDLEVGDLIVAENFSDPDLIPVLTEFSTSSSELASPANRGMEVKRGNLFTAISVIDSLEERTRLRETGAFAVDMETEVIARACAVLGIPMVSLRVISDTPEKPFPLPASVLFDIDRQRTKYVRLLSFLLFHPGAIPPLIRFQRQINVARERLRTAIPLLVGLLDKK